MVRSPQSLRGRHAAYWLHAMHGLKGRMSDFMWRLQMDATIVGFSCHHIAVSIHYWVTAHYLKTSINENKEWNMEQNVKKSHNMARVNITTWRTHLSIWISFRHFLPHPHWINAAAVPPAACDLNSSQFLLLGCWNKQSLLFKMMAWFNVLYLVRFLFFADIVLWPDEMTSPWDH